MSKPKLHLICNAHLDPVWQWRWEEGCAEALSTFGVAVRMLKHHPDLIFNHNEALLYRWVETYDPRLFEEIKSFVRQGRWCISGGWYLQPDVNLPGIESIIRQILVGRTYFKKTFGVVPTVAYNFDSFGHSGGLPQVLLKSGYKMYIHMRPHQAELPIPSDFYRWQGVDGSEILAYRIAVGLYHTERDNILLRLKEGKALALKLNRDVPIFWGVGNHGGGATIEDLEKIDDFIKKESDVEIIHSTTEKLYDALKPYAEQSPIVKGDLQRIFTGCYTSLSRIKRRAQRSLGEVVQTEALSTIASQVFKFNYPSEAIDEIWRDHLFNDFHDILPGSCTEPAEQDSLEIYGRASESMRRIKFSTATAFSRGEPLPLYVPVTVLNANPSCSSVPLEVECMLDLRPKWTGKWHLKISSLDGKEVSYQEEQPESLLPFNGWRRKICFMDTLPHVGAAHYNIDIVEGTRKQKAAIPALKHTLGPTSGLIEKLSAGGNRELLAGKLLQPLVVEDLGDAWGADVWNYRNILGKFMVDRKSVRIIDQGPVRTITESIFTYGKSLIRMHTISYAQWNVLEFRLRIQWNEIRKRLKLSIPTVFKSSDMLYEVPGGAIIRPSDGEEHVHGRWILANGNIKKRDVALGIITSGVHGFDSKNGEIRLSVLRSAAYCHEKGFILEQYPLRKYMDQGVHDVRILITAGDTETVRESLAGLADWLSAPPMVYSHLPIGETARESKHEFLNLTPSSVRLLALKQSTDGSDMIIRIHETTGKPTVTNLHIVQSSLSRVLTLKPFEIKTLRIDSTGACNEVSLLED
jgi:alpha-mannosidase